MDWLLSYLSFLVVIAQSPNLLPITQQMLSGIPLVYRWPQTVSYGHAGANAPLETVVTGAQCYCGKIQDGGRPFRENPPSHHGELYVSNGQSDPIERYFSILF